MAAEEEQDRQVLTNSDSSVFVEGIVRHLRRTVRSGKTKPEAWRRLQLQGLLRLLVEREEDISRALAQDLRKSAYETYIFEISLAVEECKLALKKLRSWMAPQKVAGTVATFPSSGAIVPEPLGVALVISTWNFPFVLAVNPMIGAIAAGCAVVLKPSEIAPATSALLAKLIPLYLDTSAIQVVEGGVPEITTLLQQNWDKIFYTGNSKVGRIIMAAASKHLTPVTLELGGKCPVYIDSTANLKVALRRIAVGKWGNNNGQACIAPDYILAEDSIAPRVVDVLKETIVEFFGKDPKTSKDLSRIVNQFHFKRLMDLLNDSRTLGKIVHGGEQDAANLYIAPTVLYDVPLDVPIMTEEIFGPLLPIIKVKGAAEAIAFITERSKPLAFYVFTTDKTIAQLMVSEVSAGGIVVNDTCLQFVVPGLPFGGVGESGTGAYHGKFSFDTFSNHKAVLYRQEVGDVYARYPPHTKHKQKIIKSLLTGDFLGATLLLLGWRQ
ncbi:unnamed protein product [Sphagnum balticum]